MMNNRKLELIKEAFGDDFDYMEPFIDFEHGVAEIPSTVDRVMIDRSKYKVFYIDGIKSGCQFIECFKPKSLPENFANNNGWLISTPPENTLVLCFSETWKDELNPTGIREAIRKSNEFGSIMISYKLTNKGFEHDVTEHPTHWKPKPEINEPIY